MIRNKSFILISIGILVIVSVCFFSNGSNNDEIKLLEIKTHQNYNEKSSDNKYIIKDKKELEKFFSLYYKIDETSNVDLDKNTIFIQTVSKGSGSISLKIRDVIFKNDTVILDIEEDSPEFGTTDMAYWILIAVVPNGKLNNLTCSDWTTL